MCENWKDSGGKGDWLDVADFGWLLFTWFALVVIRCFTIAILWPILKWLEQRYSHAHQLEWKDGVVMAWGGLRGAVGLALALVVQEERAHSDEAKSAEQLLFLVSGIAMLTLLINGWSCKTLLDYLGMTVESSDTRHVRAYAKSAAAHAAAIALHDIVAKYGLDVPATQVKSRNCKGKRRSAGTAYAQLRGWAWSRSPAMIPGCMGATLGRRPRRRGSGSEDREQRTGVAAHAGHVSARSQGRVLGDDREGVSSERFLCRANITVFLRRRAAKCAH